MIFFKDPMCTFFSRWARIHSMYRDLTHEPTEKTNQQNLLPIPKQNLPDSPRKKLNIAMEHHHFWIGNMYIFIAGSVFQFHCHVSFRCFLFSSVFKALIEMDLRFGDPRNITGCFFNTDFFLKRSMVSHKGTWYMIYDLVKWDNLYIYKMLKMILEGILEEFRTQREFSFIWKHRRDWMIWSNACND